jgi:thioredoxin reductase/NAD-dependent dihydropyrimidine dehydrogenase PreA subunit
METLVLVGTPLIIAVVAAWQITARRKRQARSEAELAEAVEQRRTLPPTLYPIVDPDKCIGSLSCLKACPEGDILGIIDGKAKLIHADRCIGHGQCALECPVGAIRLVVGTAERGVDLPEVDEYFESSRPGVHVIGELGGMGLIKNAVSQGKQVGRRLSELVEVASPAGRAAPAFNELVDVAIIGAGPAGLAAAAELRSLGRSVRVLDQQTTGGTIAQYPRQKLVLTEPLELPFVEGRLGKKIVSKEELLETFHELVSRGGIQVDEGVKVSGLTGSDGAFELITEKGPVPARKVVLATGRRGSPRKLGVPGEQLAKVTYSLADAEQYDSCSVLVVGGGDSAVEAAVQLAEKSSAKVTVSYRGATFSRCRAVNQRRIEQLRGEGKIDVRFSTNVSRIEERAIVLRSDAGEEVRIANDFVLVLAGGELPVQFLSSMGVEMRRYHGEEHKAFQPTQGRTGLAKERQAREARRQEMLNYVLVGAFVVAWLSWVGRGYYTLSQIERLRSPLHATLKSAGSWGHGVGIVATLVMMGNFLYPLRKRHPKLKGVGSIARWLDFHVFVGFMSPLVIAFHAAFQSKNHLATATASALVVVMITGVIGRFLYGLVPSERGSMLERAEVVSRLKLEKARLLALLHERHDPARLEELVEWATGELSAGSLFEFLVHAPAQAVQLRLRILGVRSMFDDRRQYDDFRDELLKASLLRTQARFFGGLKKLMGSWRIVHASLAVFLVVAIVLHIGVSLYFGYGLGSAG